MNINVNCELLGINEKCLSSSKNLRFLRNAHEQIHGLDCSNGTGWVELPNFVEKAEFANLKQCAKEVQENSDVLLVIGIGGSFLGAYAGISMLKSQPKTEVRFIGNSLDSNDLNEVLAYCKDKQVSVNVISKSGTTMETAVVFEIVENFMKKKYKKGKEYKNRIFVTTDYERGELREIATKEGYRSFVIPRNVGGRYSVLTPVGLFPMAVAGISIEKIINGAKHAYEECSKLDVNENPAYKYALSRYMVYKKGRKVECFCSFDSRLKVFEEWLKQLFAESEGKKGKGLFVTSLNYTTDLHSMGQFVQEGSPILFESFIDIKKPASDLKIDKVEDGRGIKNVEGMTVNELNRLVYESVKVSHSEAKVPIVTLEMEELNEENVGYLFYFYEMACGASAYLLGVNPFDQPGVEVYKKHMRNKIAERK